MAEIRLTEEAHRWLRDIHDYIAADNPAAEKKVVSGIYDNAQMLSSFPGIGHRYRAEAEGKTGSFSMGIIGLLIFSSRHPVSISWAYSTGHLISTGTFHKS